MKSAQKVDPGEENFPLAPAGTRTSELKFEERQTDRQTDRDRERGARLGCCVNNDRKTKRSLQTEIIICLASTISARLRSVPLQHDEFKLLEIQHTRVY